MTTFTPDQWVILVLAFALGLFLGMALLASPKWKRRYRDEVTRREAVEAENAQLRREASEMDSLRSAAARDEARRQDVEPVGTTTTVREEAIRPADAAALRTTTVREETLRPADAAALRAAADREASVRPVVAPRTDTVIADVRPSTAPEALRAEAARVEAEHPGEAESLRQAAARDEERRRADSRPL